MQQNLPFGIIYEFNIAAELYMNMAFNAGGNEKRVLAKAFELAIDGQFKAAASAFESLYGTSETLQLAGLLHAGLCHLLCGEICAAAIAFREAKLITTTKTDLTHWENNAEDMREPFMDEIKKGLQNGVPFLILDVENGIKGL